MDYVGLGDLEGYREIDAGSRFRGIFRAPGYYLPRHAQAVGNKNLL